jgi:signal transduction histidine kinase/ActR/RegA family two-component response regulator
MKKSAVTFRLLIAGAAMTAFMLVTALVVYRSSRSVQESSHFIYGDAVPGSLDAHAIRGGIKDEFRYLALAVSADDPADRERNLREAAAEDAVVVRSIGEYRSTELINPVLDNANLVRFEESWKAYRASQARLIELLRDGLPGQAHKYFHEVIEPGLKDALVDCDTVVAYNDGNASRLALEITQEVIWLRRAVYLSVTLAVVCGVIVTLNLMARFREERELALQRLRFAHASRTARLAMWVRDPRTGLIEWSNDIGGITDSRTGAFPRTSEGWFEMVHEEDRARVRSASEGNRLRGESYEIEYRIGAPGGPVTWLRAVGDSSPGAHGSTQAAMTFGVIRDITEQKTAADNTARLEAQLRQAQKLEAIGTLAGGIAHDFNNVLTGIVGNAELAGYTMRENNHSDLYGEYLDTILRAGRRASDLVRQILAFSRRAEQSMDVLSLKPIVTEVLQLIRSTVPANIELHSDVGVDIPLVIGDPSQIHQVLVNLCTNAVHAMRGANGRMEVRLDSLTADVEFLGLHPELRPGRQVRVSVSDTGHGMDASVLKRIFEPFFTTKSKGEGTGLGLSVVHGIVKAHGGGIYCYSRPGEGTVFHVYFPAVAEEQSGGDCLRLEQTPRGDGERILLVDDEDDMRRTSAAMLGRLGYKVAMFASAADALAAFRKGPMNYDLVVTDLAMPAVTGLEFAAKVFRQRPGIPIVLITGFAGNLTEKSLKEIGFNELLLKPLTIDSLGLAVHRALHSTAVGAA